MYFTASLVFVKHLIEYFLCQLQLFFREGFMGFFDGMNRTNGIYNILLLKPGYSVYNQPQINLLI